MIEPYYADEWVTLYHGDALELLPQLGIRVDLVLTDPPFFMPAQHYAARRDDWRRSWGDTSILTQWFERVVAAVLPLLRPTGSFLTFCDDESYPVFYPALYRRFDHLNALVWDKGQIGMGNPWRHTHELMLCGRWGTSKWLGGAGQSDVLRVKNVPSSERLHPVDKPNDLLRMLIALMTEPGDVVLDPLEPWDVVLDPFVGGGSTLRAAKDLGRKAIGIEIEERYCEVAARRMGQEVLAV